MRAPFARSVQLAFHILQVAHRVLRDIPDCRSDYKYVLSSAAVLAVSHIDNFRTVDKGGSATNAVTFSAVVNAAEIVELCGPGATFGAE